ICVFLIVSVTTNKQHENINRLTTERSHLVQQQKQMENQMADLKRFKKFVLQHKNFPVLEFCPEHMKPQCFECRIGWLSFKTYCYLLYGGQELKSWDEGRQYCRENGGDLVVIDNLEEQEFITLYANLSLLTPANFWIGLHHTPKGWFWVDGRRNTFDFWIKGIPHTSGAALHIAQTKFTENWKAEGKAVKNRFFCEHPIINFP
uniref:C-type lectin domain-containing protein n=1 Tax=Poecilia formosa TaxID=48698 RepID=A0A087X5H1_POEFO